MTYKFTQAADSNAIAEREFAAAADEIASTGISSCLFLVAKTEDGGVGGVHINVPEFTETVMKKGLLHALGQIGYVKDTLMIVGELNVWRDTKNFPPGIDMLKAIQTFYGVDAARTKDRSGIVKARIVDGKIVIS